MSRSGLNGQREVTLMSVIVAVAATGATIVTSFVAVFVAPSVKDAVIVAVAFADTALAANFPPASIVAADVGETDQEGDTVIVVPSE
jgi:hypothetical protein